MAHDQRRQHSNRNKDRATSSSQPLLPQTADTDDPKRIANRLAQRKFRRQRKDYIAHLENELALCRAGASDELTQRRREVAKLHEEKAELRELLEHVANTIARVCRVEVTICDQGSRPEVHAGPITPSQTESHSAEDDQITRVADQGKIVAQCHAMVDGEQADFDIEAHLTTQNHDHHDHTQDDDQTIVVRLADEAPTIEADLGATTSQVDNTKSGRTQNTLAVVALPSPVQDQLPMDMSVTWDDGAYEPGEDRLVPLEDSGTSGNSSQQSIEFPDKNQENLPLPVSSNKFAPRFDQILFAAPGTLRGICRSSGCPGRHGGSEKTQLMSIMLRRQVDEAVGYCLNSGQLESLESIQAMESTLVTTIVNAIVSMHSMATSMLGIHSMCLAGGSAWVVWQIAKTFWVLPRLADSGIVARAAELGFSSDLFGDSMPDWLRPTDIQKTFEHNSAIDFIPWPHLRELLIMHQDDADLDDILINILKRELPTGADSDRSMEVNTGHHLEIIRNQFLSRQDRLLRDSFYNSISMFRLREDLGTPTADCSTLVVDSMMAGNVPMLTAS